MVAFCIALLLHTLLVYVSSTQLFVVSNSVNPDSVVDQSTSLLTFNTKMNPTIHTYLTTLPLEFQVYSDAIFCKNDDTYYTVWNRREITTGFFLFKMMIHQVDT